MALAAAWVLLAMAVPARAGTAEDLSRLEVAAREVGGALDALSLEVRRASSGAGAADAVRRYQDALGAWIVKDYEEASRLFFTLVGANALDDPGMAADAQFYLGDALLEVEAYGLAEDALQAILDTGERHPFFPDAVRRQLELYSIVGDAEAFDALYQRFIATARVKPDDAIYYSLGKSHWRRGALGAARSSFQAVAVPASPAVGEWYARAQYFLGTLEVSEGKVAESVPFFEAAAAVAEQNPELGDLADLSNLALGRVLLEGGDTTGAAERYTRLGNDSPWFADSLYEVTWAFVRGGDYPQALETIDIFLLGFPEHAQTARMKLVRGHLERKLELWPKAVATYDEVVASYGPLASLLEAIGQDSTRIQGWYAHLALEGERPSEDVPGYALEMVGSRPTMERVLNLAHEVEAQRADLELSVQLAGQVRVAIGAGGALGGGVGDLRRSLLERAAELARLEVAALQLEGRVLGAKGVQVAALEAEVAAVDLEGEPMAALTALRLLAPSYAEARRSLDGELGPRFERLWLDFVERDRAVLEADRLLRRVEEQEVSTVLARLQTEEARLAELSTLVDATAREVHGLGHEAAEVAFAEVAAEIDAAVLQADMGLVDASWVQRTAASEGRKDVIAARDEELKDLSGRFRGLRQSLEEEAP